MAASKARRGRSDRNGTASLRRKARILAEADRTTDVGTAERHGIHDRTIRSWRAELADSPDLAGEYASVVRALDAAWASELRAHLLRALGRLDVMMGELDVRQFPALAGHVKSITEQLVAHEALSGPSEDDRPGAISATHSTGADSGARAH